MPEKIAGMGDRIRCSGELVQYLDDKGIEYRMGSFGEHSDAIYHHPPHINEESCFIVDYVVRKYWNGVVRRGLDEIASKYNCELLRRSVERVDESVPALEIVFHVVNKL
jgi:hypothetical protein